MFGTIGRFTAKPGSDEALAALDETWISQYRPNVPGSILMFTAKVDDTENDRVMVFLCQDKKTYLAITDDPVQDAHFRKMMEHVAGEVSWTDVDVQRFVSD